MVQPAVMSTLSAPIFLEMGSGNLGVAPRDLQPTSFDFETFPEQDLWPVAGASPTSSFKPTLEVAATFFTLLEQVVTAFGTVQTETELKVIFY